MYKKSLPAILAALLLGSLFALPAASADDPPAITRRDFLVSTNNLKQIVLAFHNHNDAYTKLPSDILDKDGKPLLSWRVAILPFVEEAKLYEQFKMDEPWDSPNNKKLIEKMPKLYAPVRVKAKAGETFYQIFMSESNKADTDRALYAEHKPRYMIGNIPDGTSNTGLVFEAGEPVIWSKPADLPFDAKKPLPKLGGLFDGEFHVGFCDGSVSLFKKDADEKELKSFIIPDDGYVVDFKKLKK
jgi:hypothetical protein